MNLFHPNGMVERMSVPKRTPRLGMRYGRGKEGSPIDTETLKIADDNDRRHQPRHDADPLRGRLVDVNA